METRIHAPFTPEIIADAMPYEDYAHMMSELVSAKRTTGPNQTEKLIEYTALNLVRWKRIEKTVPVLEEARELFSRIEVPMYWIVLSEAWCGDAAQNLPVIGKMAALSTRIELRILLRDEHPELMDAYLTNGSRSIPKLIMLRQDNLAEIAPWGPRPNELQQMVKAHKANPQEEYAEFAKKIQLWYAHDKGISIQKEFMDLLRRHELLS